MIRLIVMTHGEFGAYLVEAAEGIVGRQEEGLATIGISSRVTVDEVGARLKNTLEEFEGSEGTIIVTDMPGGTPCNISLPIVQNQKNIKVLSGVNLYMLVAAFNNRKSMSLEELSEKMISAGQRSIADIKKLLAAHS